MVQEIKLHLKPEKEQKILLKSIVLNKECECGLLDFTKIKRDSYNYFPILFDKNKVYWLKDDTAKAKLKLNIDEIYKEFLDLNRASLNEQELKLISLRSGKGIIHFGSSIIQSSLDLYRDSALMNKYLEKTDLSIKVKYK